MLVRCLGPLEGRTEDNGGYGRRWYSSQWLTKKLQTLASHCSWLRDPHKPLGGSRVLASYLLVAWGRVQLARTREPPPFALIGWCEPLKNILFIYFYKCLELSDQWSVFSSGCLVFSVLYFVLCAQYWVFNIECWVLNVECWVPCAQYWVFSSERSAFSF